MLQRTLHLEFNAVLKSRNFLCLYYRISVDMIEPHQVILLFVRDPILQNYACEKIRTSLHITSVFEIYSGCNVRKTVTVSDQEFQNWL